MYLNKLPVFALIFSFLVWEFSIPERKAPMVKNDIPVLSGWESAHAGVHHKPQRIDEVLPAIGFSWEMPARFGLDENNNQLIDLRNTFAYTNPDRRNGTPRFKVKFSASFDPAQFQINRVGDRRRLSFQWQVLSTSISHTSVSPDWEVYLAEGVYDVQLVVSREARPLSIRDTIVQRVPVEDILIVSLGDSFSSGEGNPERHRNQPRANNLLANQTQPVWADDGTANGRSNRARDHKRSHRSTLAWPAQAALKLEGLDPLNSVTFVSVAASGATIRSGLTGPYRGVKNEPLSRSMNPMPSQVDQVSAIVGNRMIDALTISIGVNDLGFADVIADYVKRIRQGAPPDIDSQLDQMETDFAALKQRLDALNIRQVYLAEYPDPTGRIVNGELYFCNEVVGDIVNGLGIDIEEQEELLEHFLQPLNRRLQQIARSFGWIYLDGISEDFINGHGYCSGYPMYTSSSDAYYFFKGNPYPQANPLWPTDRMTSWFRTAAQASTLQGPLQSVIPGTNIVNRIKTLVETKGTLHPNEFGHLAVRDRFLDYFSMPIEINGLHGVDTDDQIAEAVLLQDSTHIGSLRTTDVDMFRIVVSNKESLKIRVGNFLARPTLQPFIRLFDRNGNELAKSTPVTRTRTDMRTRRTLSYHDHNEVYLDHIFDSGGTYYIGISVKTNESYNPVSGIGDYTPQASYGPYQLWINHREGQPDNTISTANPLRPGQTVGYAIEHERDVDMFRFRSPSSGKYQIKVSTNLVHRGSNNGPPGSISRPNRQPVPNRVNPNIRPDLSRVLRSNLNPRIVIFDAQGQVLAQGKTEVEHPLTARRNYYIGISSDDISTYQADVGIAQLNPLRSSNTPTRPGRLNPGTTPPGRRIPLNVPRFYAPASTGKYSLQVARSGT